MNRLQKNPAWLMLLFLGATAALFTVIAPQTLSAAEPGATASWANNAPTAIFIMPSAPPKPKHTPASRWAGRAACFGRRALGSPRLPSPPPCSQAA